MANVPEKYKPLNEIKKANPKDLSEAERRIQQMYVAGMEADKESPFSSDPEMQKISTYAANGKASFLLPDDDTPIKKLETVILFSKKHFSYFGPETDESPDGVLWCQSWGGVDGNPTEDGAKAISFLRVPPFECPSCQANQFGSGDRRGKACSNKFRQIHQIEGLSEPAMFNIPPTSYRVWNSYKKGLERQNIYLCTIKTIITPHYCSAGNREWAEFTFERGPELPTREASAAMEAWARLEQEWNAIRTMGQAAKSPDKEPPDDNDDVPF